jgi:hypothetical protein
VLLFVPLGVGLHLLLENRRRAVLLALLTTLAIETLQWRVIPGRDAALSDVVSNSLGGWLGAVLASEMPLLWRARGAHTMRYSLWWSAVVIGILFAVSFLLLPGRAGSQYRVQWMVTRPNTDRFSGTLLSASLNSMPLRPVVAVKSGLFTDTIVLRAVVSGGDSLSRRGAEILRVATFSGEALLLGQRGDALVFRTFTNASRYRFHSLLIALPGQFASNPSGEFRPVQIDIEGRSTASYISLAVTRGSTTSGVTVPRTVSLGWTLLLPWNIGIGPGWWPANVLWLVMLVFPASFLAARAAQRGVGVKDARAPWWPLALVIVALATLPAAMGLSPLGVLDWTGVAVGVAAGVGVARVAPREATTL